MRILIAEDEVGIAKALKLVLEKTVLPSIWCITASTRLNICCR